MPKPSIRPYLERQADRVEATLAAHRAPGRIVGGTTGPRIIRFFLNPTAHVRFSKIKALADDISMALQVPQCTITKGGQGLIILTFPNPNPHPVSLRTALDNAPSTFPASTFILGVNDAGSSLFARLADPTVAHILISGTTGSGKSTLLRSITATLAFLNAHTHIQLILISPKSQTFEVFTGLRHLIRQPIANMHNANDILHDIETLLQKRNAQGIEPGHGTPRVIAIIDELADLVQHGGEDVKEVIARIAQHGRQTGIHLIAATQYPGATILGTLMRANFPLRLVGKVVSAADAVVAAGRAGTNAHLLGGKGDFLAASASTTPERFQAPLATDKDIRLLLATAYTSTDIVETITFPPRAHLTDLYPGQAGDNARAHLTRVQEAVTRIAPYWAEIRPHWYAGTRGVKTRLVQMTWGTDYRYEGSFAKWITAAVEELEHTHALQIASTITTPAPHIIDVAPSPSRSHDYAQP